MFLYVKEQYIIDYKELKVTFDHFNFLTGKSIDFSKRINTTITLQRKRGHLYIFDEKFILNEYYKKSKKSVYKCVHIDKNNHALLVENNNTLNTVSSNNTYGWSL